MLRPDVAAGAPIAVALARLIWSPSQPACLPQAMIRRRSWPKCGTRLTAWLPAVRVVSALAVAALAITPWSATAQSPPAANLLFVGDFETGTRSQWSGGQCANTGVPSSDSAGVRGTVNLTVRVVGQGRYAARFNLPAADANQACELLDERPIGLGTDDYYGLMVLFPQNWREPSSRGWGLSIAQFSFQGIWGAPVSLNAHARNIALNVQSGLCSPVTSAHPGCAYSSGSGGNIRPMLAVPAPLKLGVWHELIVHVYHSTDSTGVVEVWHRLKGETRWRKTVSFHGYPTVQWTEDRLPVLKFNATVDKVGAYRGNADFPLSVWQDGFVRANSFDAAAAALP